MPLAWIEPANTVRDVAQGDPTQIYAPEIAVLYDTEVPEGTVNGATLIAGVWTNPIPYVPPPPPPLVVPVPESVTLFQARAALLLTPSPIAGKTMFDLVDEHCTAEGGLALQAWNYVNTVERNSQFVIELVEVLENAGATEDQVNDMFRLAASIDGNSFAMPGG